MLVTSLTKLTVAVPEQLSVAVTPVVTCGGTADAQVTVTGAGHVMLGATLSNTVIIWLQVEVFPHSSEALKVRVTVK